MTFATKDDARKAYERFVRAYYDGDDSSIAYLISKHTRGYMVSIYSLRGTFLTFV